VNLILKYYEERLDNIPTIKNVYLMLFKEKLLDLDRHHYEEKLLALNHDMIKACLFHMKRLKTGKYQISATNKNVRYLLTGVKK
ncbi:MAG: hypothetical protein KAH77_10685, partial [Thiomargarita sp.]|nr:hypothetical protein [Thiomargarita sp.]